MSPASAADALARSMSEAELQRTVTEMLTALGYLWYHTHDSRRSPAGFLDLVAVRRRRLLFIELKREGKNPTAEQQEWLDALIRVEDVADFQMDTIGVHVWRPSDLINGTIERILQ